MSQREPCARLEKIVSTKERKREIATCRVRDRQYTHRVTLSLPRVRNNLATRARLAEARDRGRREEKALGARRARARDGDLGHAEAELDALHQAGLEVDLPLDALARRSAAPRETPRQRSVRARRRLYLDLDDEPAALAAAHPEHLRETLLFSSGPRIQEKYALVVWKQARPTRHQFAAALALSLWLFG